MGTMFALYGFNEFKTSGVYAVGGARMTKRR
jgi:hypothetical protein